MTYFEAALSVLRRARKPMTTREIADAAIRLGLIRPKGKTPEATMSAELYRRARGDSPLMKLETRGKQRAVRGTVKWQLRR